ncbi:YjcQ family protein [Ihubacter massiliensis]|uniref:YjcQ family protein n=1 Tax=Ihubacter massiliensis TaxID=1852367 RepID=UPI0020985DCB|nr:YjcQ family protein [Ihubacter massiliensis]MCO7122034.1 YjcQ family protein [Ihubacter massiliensis]
MNNFKKIYEILQILEKSMDLQEFDKESLSKERLELSEARWCRIMAMLVDEGYIEGVQTWKSMDSEYPRICVVRPEITLKGLQYLEENSLMKKAANMAKGIVDVIS